MTQAEMKEKRREVEALAKKLIKTVEKNEDLLDWSAMTRYPSLNYRKIVALANHWDVMREAKDFVNEIFESRLVKIGLERSKASDSFVKFMLSRRHGWSEHTEVEMKVEANVSFRDIIAGANDAQKDADEEASDESYD